MSHRGYASKYRSTFQQAEVKKLKEELYTVRRALISAAGTDAERILSPHSILVGADPSVPGASERARAWDWLEGVVGQLLDLANPEPTYSENRAPCPLCRGSSKSPYSTGFSFPEGLRRHLLGAYNADQCEVTRAALELATDYLSGL